MSIISCLSLDVSMSFEEAKHLIIKHLETDDKEILARILYDVLTDAKEHEKTRDALSDLSSLLEGKALKNTNLWNCKTIYDNLERPSMKDWALKLAKEKSYPLPK